MYQESSIGFENLAYLQPIENKCKSISILEFQSYLKGIFIRVSNSISFTLGRILLVPSLFSRLSSIFGRLQNPVLLVLSSKNGRFRRPSKPSAS